MASAWWTAVSGRRRRPAGDLFSLVAVGAAGALQYLIEGLRWQLIPLYLAGALVVVLSLWDLIIPTPDIPDRRRSVRSATWATLGVGAAIVLPLALPVVDVPGEPTGPVGTISYHATDSSRIEVYGEDPGRPREVAIQIWYPAARTDGFEKSEWVDDIEALAPTAAEYLGFPSFVLDHLALTETNAYFAAPAAAGRHPVIVYSHGWGGFRSVAVNQMETLAGAGFVVVAIDHTYAALSTTLSDGEARRIDLDALPSQDEVTPEEFVSAREMLSLTLTEDIWFALDQLESIDRGEIPSMTAVAGHLDFDEIGFLGHSTGGGAVVTACLGDPRCDAVLGQDPWLEPIPATVIERGLSVPFLAIRSEQWQSRPNDELVFALVDASAPTGRVAYIDGTIHRDFTALPAISPLASLAGLSGSLGRERTFMIVDAVNVAFFGEHLRDGPPFPQRLAGFEEIVFDE